MRVGVISMMTGFAWGGSEELWAEMVEYALAQRHEVAASTVRWPQLAGRLRLLEAKGCRLFPRPWYRRMAGLRARVRALSRVLDAPNHGLYRLWRWKPDVLCVSEGNAFTSASDEHFNHLVTRRKLPYVIVCQANWPQNFPADRDRNVARKIYADAYKVVFVADENWRTAERQLACRIDNGIVLRNPIAQSRLRPIAFPNTPTARLAMVARLDIQAKGHDLAFEVLSRPEWRVREWTLDLFGEGPSRAYLLELARHFDIADRVVFRGHEVDLNRVWAENQLLLLPSRAEGTPIALMEAMICGRPAVVTDVGGNSAWVRDGVDGFVAKAPTAELVAEVLERAWQSRAAWSEMGLSARQRALALHDPAPGRTLFNLLAEAVKPNILGAG